MSISSIYLKYVTLMYNLYLKGLDSKILKIDRLKHCKIIIIILPFQTNTSLNNTLAYIRFNPTRQKLFYVRIILKPRQVLIVASSKLFFEWTVAHREFAVESFFLRICNCYRENFSCSFHVTLE